MKTTPRPIAVADSRVFTVGGALPSGAPPWLQKCVRSFTESVADPAYPCYFGHRALQRGELRGTWVDPDRPEALAHSLQAFLDATRPYPQRRIVLAAFCEPPRLLRGHDWFEDKFWSTLRDLRAHDSRPWPQGYPTETDDPRWEFGFGGEAMFVFAAAPTHMQRRSRNLSPGLVLLFQPRNIFRRIESGTSGGTAARRKIRGLLADWDRVPVHPSMGGYGDEDNHEWTQYFIAEHDRELQARCPLSADTAAVVPDLIRRQATATPDRPAVVGDGTVLTYRQLLHRATRLAQWLCDRQVGMEQPVGVLAPRTPETVIALLGVWLAGAAYVPLDPVHPAQRRAFQLMDSGCTVLVGDVASDEVPAGVLAVSLAETTAGSAAERPPAAISPNQLAYVVYTSGSTGKPKGVAVTHRQLAHGIASNLVDCSAPDAFLVPLPFTADASGTGLYWPLTTGGCVVIPTEAQARDPQQLADLVELYGVTHVDCVPAYYRMILDAAPNKLESLRLAIVGGETCSRDLIRVHRKLLPNTDFEVRYGPTEATIWCIHHRLVDAEDQSTDPLLGFAAPGARVYLLNSAGEPVPPETMGEIHLGGELVARGYHDRPALTAANFVPDPFGGEPGRRLYRTGDLAVLGADGRLRFRGRRDGQVKVRGHRVELGEVEGVLSAHPDVGSVAVVVEHVASEAVLVAHVETTLDGSASEELSRYAAEQLPDHMIPSRWVVHHRLPRNRHHKVDYASLQTAVAPVSAAASLVGADQ